MKKLDLRRILDNCKVGTELWHDVYGHVKYMGMSLYADLPIELITSMGERVGVTSDGRHSCVYKGSCVLYPSKDERDWTTFNKNI